MDRDSFRKLFDPAGPILIGACHLEPLPGSPRYAGRMAPLIERAVRDARAYAEGGMAGVLVENFGDAPFYPDDVPKETVAAMAIIAAEVRRAVSIPVGVNVLRNDAAAALAIAAAAGLAFVRINVHVGVMATDQGLLEGRAHETLRMRSRLAPDVKLFCDVLVKHGRPVGGADTVLAAEETIGRGLADAVILTGEATGRAVDLSELRRVRTALGSAPVLAGSGVSPEMVRAVLEHADGAIVGTSLKRGEVTEAPVDPVRVRALVAAAQGR